MVLTENTWRLRELRRMRRAHPWACRFISHVVHSDELGWTNVLLPNLGSLIFNQNGFTLPPVTSRQHCSIALTASSISRSLDAVVSLGPSFSPDWMNSKAPFWMATAHALHLASYFPAHGAGDTYVRKSPLGRVMIRVHRLAVQRQK